MPIVMSQRHSTHLEELKKLCALKIINIKPEDSGHYSVVVENQFGSDDSSANLFVISSSDIKPIQNKVPQSPVIKPVYDEIQREVPAPPKIIKNMPTGRVNWVSNHFQSNRQTWRATGLISMGAPYRCLKFQ